MKHSRILILALIALFAVGCASSSTSEEPQPQPKAEEKSEPKTDESAGTDVSERGNMGAQTGPDLGALAEAAVKKLNEQLANHTITGYKPFQTECKNLPTFNKWVELALPVISKAVDQVPDGYTLWVVGHATNRGDYAQDRIDGVAKGRAKAVYDYLASKGVKTTKVKHKGVADKENSGDDPSNKRVSFRIEKNS